MTVVTIKWLEDETHCETCGINYATGAVVSMDGVTVLEMIPVANCQGGKSWFESDILRAVLQHLGHPLVEDRA